MTDGRKEWKNGNHTNKREQDVKQPEDRKKARETLKEWKRHISKVPPSSLGALKSKKKTAIHMDFFSSLRQKLTMEAAASRPFATESL